MTRRRFILLSLASGVCEFIAILCIIELMALASTYLPEDFAILGICVALVGGYRFWSFARSIPFKR